MSNIEVVRTLFETYSRGDYAAAAACLAPGVVYQVGQEVPAFGPDEVQAMWERWDSAWDEMETVPEEFIDAGDNVVVTVHYSARGRGSGIEYDERLFDVYTVRDGKCVRKLEFRDLLDLTPTPFAGVLGGHTGQVLAESYRAHGVDLRMNVVDRSA